MSRLLPKLFILPLMLLSCAVADAANPQWKDVPGVVIDYRPASSGIYIGSPSLVVLPNGDYIAAHDEFGPKSAYYTNAVTDVFRSTDRGETWKQISRITDGALWATLFVHRDALYMIGCSKEYGLLVIRRSDDGGATWTHPKDKNSGLLAEGKWHTSAVPVIEHDGRLWRAVEDAMGGGNWGELFRAHMLSIPVDADLLHADSWTISEPLPRNTQWLNGTFVGWLEGNAIAGPDGGVVDMLRVAAGKQDSDIAAIVHVSAEGKQLSFDPEKDFVHDFPGGDKKFSVRFDPKTREYWTLCNSVLPAFKNAPISGDVRNAQVLASSADLRNWTTHCIVLYHPDWRKHGFQYLDWQFDGDDIIAVSRTAYDDGAGGAHRAHDANFITFHRFKNFRTLSMKDSVPTKSASEK